MTEDKKSGEDSDFDFEPVDDIKLIPINESPIKLTPTKRVDRQVTPTKNRYSSPKLFRNDLNRPKISAKKLNPILENGTTLHSQATTTSTNRVSMKFKSPSSSVASYSRKIDASPYKMSSPSRNITSVGSNTHQRHSLISKMKTKSESNKFCPIYDIDKIMVGKKMLGNEYTKEFKQLKYTDEEFHMIRSTCSGYDNDGDIVIKKSTITEFYFSDDSTHAIYMNLKRVPKDFPCASDVRIFSKDQVQKGIIFYLSKNIDIPNNEIDKFKEIFDDRWIFINITSHIFNSLLSYDDSTKHKSPESPTHKDSIISNFVENGNNSDNISVCGSQSNDLIVEISSSPTDKLNEGNSSKQHSEIDIENDTQASTPNDTNGDIKIAPLQSPNSKLTLIDKTPTKNVGDGSIYSVENVFKASSPTSTSSRFTPRRSSRISQRPISPDFNADITRWIAEVSSLDNVLTYRLPNNKAITIHGDDLQRLKSGIFLNDTLIEFYSQWLLANYSVNDVELNDETYIANPFFYAFIQNDQFERVRKWTSKVDLFKKEYVFIPINENLHWYLALILNLPNYDPLKGQPNPKDPKKEDPIIVIFDSLFLKHRKTFEQLEQFLLEEYKFRNPEKFAKSKIKETEEEGDNDDIFYLPKLTIHTYAKVPGQDNFSDCGVYLLYYLKTILSSPIEQKNQLLTDRTLKINFECSMKGMRREIVEKIHDLTKESQGFHGLLGLIDDVDNDDVFKSQKSVDNGVGEEDDDDLIMEG